MMSDQKMAGSTPLKRRWSCPDTERSKALRRTLILEPKSGSPLLMLFLEEGGYRLYSPEEDRVYETKGEFSGYRFLANSGKWFLAVDSESRLCIIDVFSEERKDLPGLESFRGDHFKVELLELEGTKTFNHGLIAHSSFSARFFDTAEDLRGLLWVDKNGDFVVVWQFENCGYLGYCKKGDDHYREITTRVCGDRRDFEAIKLEGLKDMVLTGYNLFIFSKRDFIRHLDLSGQDGFKDVSPSHRFPMCRPAGDMFRRDEETRKVSFKDKIAVTPSQKVLIVHTRFYESKATLKKHRSFQFYEKDSRDVRSTLLEVNCLGDEALFVDLGITVPADQTLGIEPDSIYFTRGHRFFRKDRSFIPRHLCLQSCSKDHQTLPNSLQLKTQGCSMVSPLLICIYLAAVETFSCVTEELINYCRKNKTLGNTRSLTNLLARSTSVATIQIFCLVSFSTSIHLEFSRDLSPSSIMSDSMCLLYINKLYSM